MRFRRLELILITLVASVFMVSCSDNYYGYKIIDTSLEKVITLDKLTKKLVDYDIIVFGDLSEYEELQHLKIELTRKLHQQLGEIVISMEIFERNDQDTLDDYISGNITEEQFLHDVNIPVTYQYDYRPIIEFAKEEGLSVIASNAPQDYVNAVGKFGLDVLYEDTDSYKPLYYAENMYLEDLSYEGKFIEKTLSDPYAISDFTEESLSSVLSNMFEALVLVDDTMAESMIIYRKRFPGTKIIHFNEDFHSNEKIGVVTRLLRRDSTLKVAVLSPILLRSDEKLQKAKRLYNVADYLILIKE
ncbi:MAG: ChaN family lipoprotein [Candidatus Cloacimonas sp.]|nr:ChaN family lipoprotein [Candidatus Cloacimonadota bacterium]